MIIASGFPKGKGSDPDKGWESQSYTRRFFSLAKKEKKSFLNARPTACFVATRGVVVGPPTLLLTLCVCVLFLCVCVGKRGFLEGWIGGPGRGRRLRRERERAREGERGIKRGGKISERDEGYILSQLIKYIYNRLYHINMRAGGPGAAGLFIQAWFGNNVQEYRSVYIHF